MGRSWRAWTLVTWSVQLHICGSAHPRVGGASERSSLLQTSSSLSQLEDVSVNASSTGEQASDAEPSEVPGMSKAEVSTLFDVLDSADEGKPDSDTEQLRGLLRSISRGEELKPKPHHTGMPPMAYPAMPMMQPGYPVPMMQRAPMMQPMPRMVEDVDLERDGGPHSVPPVVRDLQSSSSAMTAMLKQAQEQEKKGWEQADMEKRLRQDIESRFNEQDAKNKADFAIAREQWGQSMAEKAKLISEQQQELVRLMEETNRLTSEHNDKASLDGLREKQASRDLERVSKLAAKEQQDHTMEMKRAERESALLLTQFRTLEVKEETERAQLNSMELAQKEMAGTIREASEENARSHLKVRNLDRELGHMRDLEREEQPNNSTQLIAKLESAEETIQQLQAKLERAETLGLQAVNAAKTEQIAVHHPVASNTHHVSPATVPTGMSVGINTNEAARVQDLDKLKQEILDLTGANKTAVANASAPEPVQDTLLAAPPATQANVAGGQKGSARPLQVALSSQSAVSNATHANASLPTAADIVAVVIGRPSQSAVMMHSRKMEKRGRHHTLRSMYGIVPVKSNYTNAKGRKDKKRRHNTAALPAVSTIQKVSPADPHVVTAAAPVVSTNTAAKGEQAAKSAGSLLKMDLEREVATGHGKHSGGKHHEHHGAASHLQLGPHTGVHSAKAHRKRK